MPKVLGAAFVGYPVKDVKRAREFYEGVLGLIPDAVFGSGEYSGVEYDLNGITLSIGKNEAWIPSATGPCIALEVEDFDATIQALRNANIQFNSEPMESRVCWLCPIQDTEGNGLIIHKRKPGH